ncbi:hypothetical protein [Spiribacter vilamensis]|uniref:Uncharacterized protein n=1 Tax=Spiribacter vilamensis TaxID=531306 RepID=A0A4Q8D1N5_9GAMM|nr:hypothetical protein [Spiribacter vilamensis]RZU99233.1 hypothetical protein EV698_1517 [Spiribacter vilamensis]TVO61780.1 hypothetical protein FPL09_06635 [Spiribacter vilamensis]
MSNERPNETEHDPTTSSNDEQQQGHDPRPVSDGRLREEMSREEVETYRKDADKAHANWFSVMNNPYGKD